METPTDPRRKRGGQPGNGNARKHGLYSAQSRLLAARIKVCRKRTRALLRLAELEIALLRIRRREGVEGGPEAPADMIALHQDLVLAVFEIDPGPALQALGEFARAL